MDRSIAYKNYVMMPSYLILSNVYSILCGFSAIEGYQAIVTKRQTYEYDTIQDDKAEATSLSKQEEIETEQAVRDTIAYPTEGMCSRRKQRPRESATTGQQSDKAEAAMENDEFEIVHIQPLNITHPPVNKIFAGLTPLVVQILQGKRYGGGTHAVKQIGMAINCCS
ncbi:hypothetical protein IW262DRAFT_1302959 [Armillaria fumosa]|nr:hypothetical protein IW262DRAFT_1302959 [Armillaria fumosa]